MSLPLLVQFGLCPVVFFTLLRVSAPYGRHYRRGWGPVMPNRLAWVMMELPALLLIALLTLSQQGGRNAVAWVPLLFWCGHYAYRTLIFPALMRPSGRSFPALLVLFAIAFNVLNGYNNAGALLDNAAASKALLTIHFMMGATVFILGFALHVHSDALIRGLRRAGGSGYHIPQGGAFRWVGSPQYLGEIIMWSGWAVLTWSPAGLAFALFTFCNLAPRARANHAWYKATFTDYPPNRRVLVPGVY